MLENTFAINDAAAQEVIYEQSIKDDNRSVYVVEGYDYTDLDSFTFYRTPPKVSGNYRGNLKTATKRSFDVEVAGVDSSTILKAPAIVQISSSWPIGITDELKTEIFNSIMQIHASESKVGLRNALEGQV